MKELRGYNVGKVWATFYTNIWSHCLAITNYVELSKARLVYKLYLNSLAFYPIPTVTPLTPEAFLAFSLAFSLPHLTQMLYSSVFLIVCLC